MTPNQDLLTRFVMWSLYPFAVAVIVLWASPLIVPQWMALNIQTLALAYGGVLAAYLAGAGAGAGLMSVKGATPSPLPNIVAALIAWFAIWPGGFLSFSVPVVWRYLILIFVFGYLLMRDLRSVEAGDLPSWYGPLRMRMTLWTCVALMLIMSRMIMWRYY